MDRYVASGQRPSIVVSGAELMHLIIEVLNSTRMNRARLRVYEPGPEVQRRGQGYRWSRPSAAADPQNLVNILYTMCFGERMEESTVRQIDSIIVEVDYLITSSSGTSLLGGRSGI